MTDIRNLSIEQYLELDGELPYAEFLSESLGLRAYQQQEKIGKIDAKSVAEDLHAMTELMSWHAMSFHSERLSLFKITEVDGAFVIEPIKHTRAEWNDLFNEAIHHKAMFDVIDKLADALDVILDGK